MKTLRSILAIIILFIISYQVCAQHNLLTYNAELPKKLTFQVELILNADQKLPDGITEMFTAKQSAISSNQHVYLLGQFHDKTKADFFQHSLYEIGYANANVVAYFRNRRIIMEDALTLSNNYNHMDDLAQAKNISPDELNVMSDATAFLHGVEYHIELDAATNQNTLNQLKSMGFIASTLPNGNYSLAATFKDYNTTIKERQYLSANGIEGLYICAYNNNELISLAAARVMEDNYKTLAVVQPIK